MSTWRARDSRGHYLPTGEIPYSLEPDAWDDTCHHQPAAAEPEAAAEDFGHRPIVSFVDGRALNRVCARCTTNTPTGIWGVRWPCTSAIVLGLVEREESDR